MIGFRVNGQFIDLLPGTQVAFQLSSPIYMGDADYNFIPGSYSLPITAPLTSRNKVIFQNSERIDSNDRIVTLDDVVFYASGIPQHVGKLYVEEKGSYGYKMSLVINDISDKKDQKLRETNLGHHESVTGTDLKNLALDIVDGPHNYDFAFFPVVNFDFINELNDEMDVNICNYQNFYNDDDGTGWDNIADYDPVITPFASLRYILEKCAENLNLTLINNFQTDDELNSLFIYANRSIHQEGQAWGTYFEYAELVPDMTIPEFIKAIAFNFFLGIIVDLKDSTMELFPLKEIADAIPNRSWTQYTGREFSYKEGKIYKNIRYDESQYKFPDNPIPDVFTIVNTPDDITGQPDGNYYATSVDTYYRKVTATGSPTGANKITIYRRQFEPINIDGELNDFELPVSPLHMLNYKKIFTAHPIWSEGQYPILNQEGSINYIHPDDTTGESNFEQKADFPFKLIFFRGWYTHPNSGNQYPYANNHSYTFDGIQLYDYSLLMNGERGIEQKFAGPWIYFLKDTKLVNRQINLPIHELSDFSWKDKIKIENNHYLVKQIKVTYTEAGITPCDCILATIK